MKKKLKICTFILPILIIVSCLALFFIIKNDSELKTIKSEKQLLKFYNGKSEDTRELLINIATMPFSFINNAAFSPIYTYDTRYYKSNMNAMGDVDLEADSLDIKDSSSSANISAGSSKDYSTTNIQVENVDEADITKTDGDYIYSISENKVIITNVMNPEEIKLEAAIDSPTDSAPEDLILYGDKLVIILGKTNNGISEYYYYKNNTLVRIYNISDKSNPKLEKSFELNQSYYTSRCINNTLYVISSGTLKKENNKIIRTYTEDNTQKEIELDNIKYIKDVNSRSQTIMAVVDLNNVNADIKISSYLMDVSNAYVSQNNIYLLDQKYEYDTAILPIWRMFGPSGIIGFIAHIDEYDDYDNYGYNTNIYKFAISENGDISYNSKAKIKGRTINQYSLDEKDNHLRIASYDDNGAKVTIFNENLKQIGATESIAKGEVMYSSRFIGNKVYLVTYKTIDPLFVIDLSDEANPKILGELHIPGYSTYLHPYDENHLIGIGMETEEIVNRDSYGKVISTVAETIGMKMALFDVSDVNNPKQISQTVIGDRRTTSAILTNPKALLFSKERELIAIPVNNYSEDFEITNSDDSYSSLVNSYKTYNKPYVAEGYFVYKINVNDGFSLKGVITHEANSKNNYSYYYNRSKLLRGLYIDENLYTVSETAVKVNDLNTMEQISELRIKEDNKYGR